MSGGNGNAHYIKKYIYLFAALKPEGTSRFPPSPRDDLKKVALSNMSLFLGMKEALGYEEE